jgi:hypothetical protein
MTVPGSDGQYLTTIYVEKVLTKPSTDHLRPKRPLHMAVELPIEEARKLVAYLTERIEQGDTGSIRYYLLGDFSHV